MSLLNFSNPTPRGSGKKKAIKQFFGIGILAGLVALGTTFAASINLNSGTSVEFGQGVVVTTACDDNGIVITPQATFFNNGDDSEFLFTMLTLTDISTNCNGKAFTIKAYKNGQSSALDLYETNSIIYDEINVNYFAGSFSFGDGGLESGDIEDIATGFAMTIGAGTQPSVALASAQDVDRITIESRDIAGTGSLVGLWKFENGSNLGLDASGNIDPLEVVGIPSQTSGRIGSAVYFADYSWLSKAGEIPGLPSGNSSYTFAAWINPDSDVPSTGGIVSYGLSSDNRSNSLRLNTIYGIWHYWYNNDFHFTSVALLTENWRHVASTYNSSTGVRTLYLDGIQMTTQTAEILPDFYAGNLEIGKTTADVPFKGKIDEVAIYNYALDSDEIIRVKDGFYLD
jgi:hypothetical protein